jgi:hypothetical protein
MRTDREHLFLTKSTFLLDYRDASSGYVSVGTRLLSRSDASGELSGRSGIFAGPHPESGSPPGWDDSIPPGQDGTLLAVVPIPGTGTSLAIVGYAIAEVAPVSAERPARPSAGRPADSGLLLDHAQRRVWASGREIPLTFQEFELLAFLSAHPATVFSRAELVELLWRRNPGGEARPVAEDSRTVDVHVSRVRQKLGPRYGQCLVTEYRVGYQFRPLPS